MGSYLSIVNNTSDRWVCNVGDDQAAIAIFGIVSTVVGAVALLAATAGAAAPLAFGAVSGATGLATITGLSVATATAILASFGTVGSVATAAGFLQLIVDQTIEKMKEEGYRVIEPGGRERFGKYSLSLWKQGHCRRVRAVPEEMYFIQDEVFMRPIFSGPTDDSNNDHDIQFWLDKFGPENEIKVLIPPPEGVASWGDVNAPLSLMVVDGPATTDIPEMPEPTVPVTLSPSSAPTLPQPFICNVCGEQTMTMPDGTVFIPNNGEYLCSDIEAAGLLGDISEAICPLLLQYLGPCGCTMPPTPGPVDTLSPSLGPDTVSPSPGPDTKSPSLGPDTVSPTPGPTPQPVGLEGNYQLSSAKHTPGCIEPKEGQFRNGNKLVLTRCNKYYMWKLEPIGDGAALIHSTYDDSKCMQAGYGNVIEDGTMMRLSSCDKFNSFQQFVWEGSGPIKLKGHDDMCLVSRGDNADYDTDPIVLKICNEIDQDRLGWNGEKK
jgi:hypothetical protein